MHGMYKSSGNIYVTPTLPLTWSFPRFSFGFSALSHSQYLYIFHFPEVVAISSAMIPSLSPSLNQWSPYFLPYNFLYTKISSQHLHSIYVFYLHLHLLLLVCMLEHVKNRTLRRIEMINIASVIEFLILSSYILLDNLRNPVWNPLLYVEDLGPLSSFLPFRGLSRGEAVITYTWSMMLDWKHLVLVKRRCMFRESKGSLPCVLP